jgi:hypothetical protein
MMSLETVKTALFWCSVINVGLLALWGLLMMFPHDWAHRIWSRWFRVSAEQFDVINFSGILAYEILIFMFNVTPYIALTMGG